MGLRHNICEARRTPCEPRRLRTSLSPAQRPTYRHGIDVDTGQSPRRDVPRTRNSVRERPLDTVDLARTDRSAVALKLVVG